jgi:F-type H+-transporting ATPase subunit delta
MIPGSLAKRYARALLELAPGPAQVDKYQKDIASFAEATESPDSDGRPLWMTLAAARYPLSQRRAVAGAIAQKIGIDSNVRKFVEFVVERGRASGISQIARHYRDLADVKAGRVRATVTSAEALDPGAVSQLKSALEKATGKQVILDTAVDKELIGGLVTQIGSYTLDRSVVTQLENMRASLKSG